MAVDRSLHTFVDAVSVVPGIERIQAKSSGPSVHFLVLSNRPWDEVVDDIEERLYPLAQASMLPSFDYDVRQDVSDDSVGYTDVFTR